MTETFMRKNTICERKKPGHVPGKMGTRLIVTIFLSLGIWTTALGREQPVPDQVDENVQWPEIGSSSASGGGISANGEDSRHPSLAIGSNGTPIVTWHDLAGGDAEIYVRRWNGKAWVEMGSGSASDGGISANNGDSRSPSLAIRSDGIPIVAWSDRSSGDAQIYVRRWNGTRWVEMGSQAASGAGISANNGRSVEPSLAIRPDGSPIIAWQDDSGGDSEIYVRRWNGSAWVEMGSGSATGGGISANNGFSFAPSLAIAPDGRPIVAWVDESGGNFDIYVRRWNGSTWEEMGNGSAFGGGISATSGLSFDPSLAVSATGTPIIAWEDESGVFSDILVRRWNGANWEEMGSGSASSGGISNDTRDSISPSLAISSQGIPIVSWVGDSGDHADIYVRRWNGTTWEEMGSGSASGNGISATSGLSNEPSLAIDPRGMPIITWADDSSGDWEIYGRRSLPFGIYLPMILQ